MIHGSMAVIYSEIRIQLHNRLNQSLIIVEKNLYSLIDNDRVADPGEDDPDPDPNPTVTLEKKTSPIGKKKLRIRKNSIYSFFSSINVSNCLIIILSYVLIMIVRIQNLMKLGSGSEP